MKLLNLSLLATLTLSSSAFASTYYKCDSIDMITGMPFEGATQSVEVSSDGMTAQVYEMAVYPGARKFPRHRLVLSPRMGVKNYSSQMEDLNVTFTLSESGNTGVLKSVGMPTLDGIHSMTLFVCERE